MVDLDNDAVQLAGLFDSPLWRKAADLAKMGLSKLVNHPATKQALMQLAPSLANSLISKIPGLDLLGPQVTQAIQDRVKNLFEDDHIKISGRKDLIVNRRLLPTTNACHACAIRKTYALLYEAYEYPYYRDSLT